MILSGRPNWLSPINFFKNSDLNKYEYSRLIPARRTRDARVTGHVCSGCRHYFT